MHWETLAQDLTPALRRRILEEAGTRLIAPARDRADGLRRAEEALRQTLDRRPELHIPPALAAELVQALVSEPRELGFLDSLMPPTSTEYTDLALNPDGSVWGRARGAVEFTQLSQHRPTVQEAWQAVEALLSPLGRACTEASPSVDAKITRDAAAGFAGARLKILHPAIAPGDGFPSMSLRFFEPNPVTPDRILAWNMVPEEALQMMLDAVREGRNAMIVGGTGTGKTTLLSALCHAIPQAARIVKIEDPEEIWLPHPNVSTLEARPAPPGSSVPDYDVAAGVDDAMRMAPSHVIVGEVRTGAAALSLFRAFMSDHAGLTTFHADGPEEALARIGVVMFADAGVPFEAASALFLQAIQLVVHIGFDAGRRRVLGVFETQSGTRTRPVRFVPRWPETETRTPDKSSKPTRRAAAKTRGKTAP